MKVHLFSEQFIWVPVRPYYSVADTRDEALKRLGMFSADTQKPQQFFGLYCVTEDAAARVLEEYFALDSVKIMDLVNYFEHLQSIRKQVAQQQPHTHKIYLRVRTYYPLLQSDTDQVCVYFTQHLYEVHRDKIPVTL